MIKINSKFKNPYFWLSVIALIFSARGVDFNEIVSSKRLITYNYNEGR